MRFVVAWRGSLVVAIGVQNPGLSIVGQIVLQRLVVDALCQFDIEDGKADFDSA